MINIAIDGPAGAGKSTVARAVAKKLGILYLDTGAMYRAMALKAMREGIDPNDKEQVLPLLECTEIYAKNIGGTQHTYLDGEDVSGLIRTPEISRGASDISAIPDVRIKLAQIQRNIAHTSDVVMDGREIGSYVIPDCENKFYVTASVDERARRRLLELKEKGRDNGMTVEDMAKDIAERDYNDSHRAFAPLLRLPEAILIDTTDLTIDEAVNAVLKNLKNIGAEAHK
ncbi:MAG: (d)CMP kinase [Clostridiales bacterium]|nr:(d)CMP kinase [Clostridiales bacterium]